MKRYEYQLFNMRAMIDAKRASDENLRAVSGEEIFVGILNKLGEMGWELIPQNDTNYFGKRELVD